MRLIVQRVTQASVHANSVVEGEIEKGIVGFLGIGRDDTEKDIQTIVRKLLSMKIWDSEHAKKWALSLQDTGYEILIVSQFTLYADLSNKKPDFHRSMKSENAKVLYDKFVNELKTNYHQDKVKDGKFGEYMTVNIKNDGPVTFVVESQ